MVQLLLLVLLVVGLLAFEEWSGVPGSAHKDCVIRAVALPSTPRLAPASVRPEPFPGTLAQEGGTVNDASCLNRTPVFGIVRPTSEAEIAEALAYARDVGLHVSVSGTRHSMGGQASFPDALVLDMRDMDRISVDEERRTVRVQAGATWRQVLEAVHARNLSVAAMPSIDGLSVGGTVSANAHGADFRVGTLASTVRSVRMVKADGSVHDLDREHQPELFRAVIGGYGLFGVILEVELGLVPSETYLLDQRVVPVQDFAQVYESDVVADQRFRMMYAHLSTSPSSLLSEAILYTYERAPGLDEPAPSLRQEQDSRVGRLVLNLARTGPFGSRLKWAAQRRVLPLFRPCQQTRNEALRAAEACLVSRNQALYNDLGLLRNRLERYTDILQEYFLPHAELASFLADARETLGAHDAVLLSASIRAVGEEDVLLDYARGPRLSVVLYLSQEVSGAGRDDMAGLTRALVRSALDHGGTFYLPYQQHYSRDDLDRAYPRLAEFFALKRRHDPRLLFMNSFYARFA